MNPKEIIISTVVLILVFAGFFLLIRRNAPKRPNDLKVDQISIEEGYLETEDDGFKKRAELQKEPEMPEEKQTQQVPQASKGNPPPMRLKEGVDYQAVMTTSMGTMKFDLYEDLTPIAVNSFVYLANKGFYNGLIFHRVIQDFMIQGGDPTGTGSGGPGYSFEDEIDKTRHLVRGSLAMANAGPNTNGSQFFIVTKDYTPWLDKLHTNFGKIIEGLDIAMAIDKVKTGPGDRPVEDVVIESVVILEL